MYGLATLFFIMVWFVRAFFFLRFDSTGPEKDVDVPTSLYSNLGDVDTYLFKAVLTVNGHIPRFHHLNSLSLIQQIPGLLGLNASATARIRSRLWSENNDMSNLLVEGTRVPGGKHRTASRWSVHFCTYGHFCMHLIMRIMRIVIMSLRGLLILF